MEEKIKDQSNATAIITLTIGCFLAFAMPFILTRETLCNAFDFSATGQIGDTIGGIVGPILNFTGLILVYLSFKQQYVANEIQRNGMNEQANTANNIKVFNIIIDLINELKEEIKLLTISLEERKTGHIIMGLEYENKKFEGLFSLIEIISLLKDDSGNHRYVITNTAKNYGHQVIYIVNLVLLIVNKISEFDFSDSDKSILKDKLRILYTSKLEYYLTELLTALKEAEDQNPENIGILGEGFTDNLTIKLEEINTNLLK
ncbi:hypothetical protein MKJ04_15225 [Pontibacter sp. E15-1]|uniref:hypothetical protein n=1 Tax=Pontibacter sp. E15-1 TaxID=2919918 RepID=UPI001F4FA67A|nr:hypothetical protein [Pontibacter sp. E15-1]MCJ8166198.1 hypothetical protein [Pontibacter sp. E15-1]